MPPIRKRRKCILRSFYSPGDILMLTAAVRDLQHCHPDEFAVDVRTSCPELWENNPHLTPLEEDDPEVEMVDCDYPLIRNSLEQPWHFLHGYMEFLNARWGLKIRPQRYRGDVHLSTSEREAPSPMAERLGYEVPYWIIVAGGKFDATVKWWDRRRYQEVVDALRGRVLFVQVGSRHHYHPPLHGVIDLRGQTTLRQMVRLMHHASGVVCPITFHMHLAAAVETRPGEPPRRAAVVIAGGRESPHWEAYPGHQFLHTIGALPCCESGGCWRSRVMPLGDGDERDSPHEVCLDVVGTLPRCMSMITSQQVVQAVESFLSHARRSALGARQVRQVEKFLSYDPHRTLFENYRSPRPHRNATSIKCK